MKKTDKGILKKGRYYKAAPCGRLTATTGMARHIMHCSACKETQPGNVGPWTTKAIEAAKLPAFVIRPTLVERVNRLEVAVATIAAELGVDVGLTMAELTE